MAVAEGFELVIPDRVAWNYSQQQWRFYLAKPDGTLLADISEARQRSVHFALNRPQTLQLKLDLAHPAVAHLLDLTDNGDRLIYAYKQGALQMVAETSTIQAVGDDSGNHSVAVNATECPWTRLARRYIGQSLNGVKYTDLDRGEIARQVLADANTTKPTGVSFGTVAATSVVTAGTWRYKPVLEAISELAADAEGYDFWFEPVIPTFSNSYRVAALHLAPLRGAARPDTIFEYGMGRHNTRSYDWLIDLQGRITRAISLPPTFPDNLGLPVKTQTDAPTEALTGQVRREAIVQSDLVDENLRQKLVNEHVAVRKYPRNVYQFQPHIDDGTGRVPVALIDYTIGDIIKGRVKDSGILLLDGDVRVYGMDVEIDQDGLEEVTLTVIDEA